MGKASKASAAIDNAIAAAKEAAALPVEPPKEPGIGHNAEAAGMLRPADDLALYFESRYQDRQNEVSDLLANIGGRTEGIEGAPAKIEDEAGNGIIAAYMEKLRTSTKIIEALRVNEKAPYLKAERFIDQYFNGMLDRLEKTQTILQARGNDYTTRKAQAERLRLAREAQEAAEKARKEAAVAAQAAADAAELEAKANRARKPENVEKLEQQTAEKIAEADVLAAQALAARDNAAAAATQAAASTADLTRTRFGTGHMATGKQVGYVEITDLEKIDLNKLRPYLKVAVIQAALNALAEQHDFNIKIEGANVGKRDAAVYR